MMSKNPTGFSRGSIKLTWYFVIVEDKEKIR